MSDTIIKVENLGKCYRLQHQGERQRYTALRDVIAEKARGLFRRKKPAEAGLGQSSISHLPSSRSTSEDFWALKDVSFDIKRGEVVGIIGRNGAGKSTLLKILSRITEPTTGRVELNGRVASLLEVGTGFHPELTGRENIFLNGAILGMSRAEIRKKFDEIVAFAEVEKFLDTPVKRYSSGMYVRLAFAVAAHLEPEILIVDEVLAVGDAQFQKKCLGKMQDVANGGRTVLFVSHNMGALRGFCTKGVLLEGGSVQLISDTASVIQAYLSQDAKNSKEKSFRHHRREGSGQVEFTKIEIARLNAELQSAFSIGEPLKIFIDYQVNRPCNGTFFLLIKNQEGIVVLSSFQRDNQKETKFADANRAEVEVSEIDFAPGSYGISAGVLDLKGGFIEWVENVAGFEIVSNFYDGRPSDQRLGIISKKLNWKSSCAAKTI